MELVAEFFGIVDGGLNFRVADLAFFGVDVVAGFKLGDLFAEVFHNNGGFNVVDIHRDIKDLVNVDEGRNPAGVEGAGISVDVDSAAVFGAEAEIAGVEL